MVKSNKYTAIFLGIPIGLIAFLLAVHSFFERHDFLDGARRYSAPIVQIEHKEIKKNKRSFPAYVPLVEIQDETGKKWRLEVETYDESLVYQVGSNLEVLCNPGVSNRCVFDTFWDKWEGTIKLSITAFILLSGGFFLLLIDRKKHQAHKA